MAVRRWAKEPWFYRDRVFPKGTVLDIGPGWDPLAAYYPMFPLIERWTVLDHEIQPQTEMCEQIRGDAIEGAERLAPRQFDTVFASHCIEHMPDPSRALRAWWNLVRPNGHLVVIAPSWVHYEREIWPPTKNRDHRTAWVLYLVDDNDKPRVTGGFCDYFMRGLVNEVTALPGGTILRALTLDEGWKPGLYDQTSSHESESAFEVVVRKAPA
jgi:SAM-dependent methyltransferase